MVNHASRRHRSSLDRALLSLISASLAFSSAGWAQTISTSTPVPPLQWINLTPLLSGSAPPPLKDASIGYDETSRTLLIFGGESGPGFPQSQTYLLSLTSLEWAKPSPPTGLTSQPPARSAAISAQDTAASYRNGHIIFGGLGNDGKPLSDVWEFSYNEQFWQQVIVKGDGPSSRWAAAGGNDLRTSTIQDPTLTTPNNTFYVAGGFGTQGAISLSDAWQFNVTGTLSANNLNLVVGSWGKLTLSNQSLPAIGGSASATVMYTPSQRIAAVGGCSVASIDSAACAEGSSYVLDVDGVDLPVPPCPAARFGASLVHNPSSISSSFGTQVFQLLGTFNASVWDDNGGLDQGEVDILDVSTGSWARILPAGDPNAKPAFPTPRQGAAVFSFQTALVGLESARTSVADTLVFGGKDSSGNYLSELWLLRAYDDTITQSGQQWTGYKSGNLQSGVNADGEGVTVTYMTQCATQLQPQPTLSGGQPTPTSSGQPTTTSGTHPGHSKSPSTNLYDTSITHKVLAPVSVALVLPAIALYRLSLPSSSSRSLIRHRIGFTYLSGFIAVVAYAVGLAGLATAFTSIKYTASLAKRSSVPTLETTHGKAGIALFAGFYGLLPVVIALRVFLNGGVRKGSSRPAVRTRTMSNDLAAEKEGLNQGRAATPLQPLSPSTPEPQARVRSGDSLGPWSAVGHTSAGRLSNDSINDDRSSPSTKSFEVTNRPGRARHASAHSLGALSQSLQGMSWSAQLRSPSRHGDIDGALSRRAVDPSTPGTAVMDYINAKSFMDDQPGPPEMPSVLASLAHLLLHAFLLGLCILSLVALWNRAPTGPFVVFLVWSACCYVVILLLAWHGVPRVSILSAFFGRLRADPRAVRSRTPTIGVEGVPFPSPHGPYQQQPPYRTHHDDYQTSISHAGHTIEDDTDDIDDGRVEEEMSRRDISIVTVPRRKLMVINPEPKESS